ncbi:hypothetical protein KL945_003748 [Ogataea haglerorum]|nr:hypothetical protein KL945_003748 [Ogataea haglerorum]
MFIWQGIVDCSTVQHETKLRIYQEKILAWLDKYPGNGEPLRAVAESFAKQLELRQGHSMALIWEKSKAVYPATAESWQRYQLLVDAAAEFDQVCMEQYSENFEVVANLRQTFVTVLEQCVAGVSVDFLDEITEKIAALKRISASFLNARKHPYAAILAVQDLGASGAAAGGAACRRRPEYETALWSSHRRGAVRFQVFAADGTEK